MSTGSEMGQTRGGWFLRWRRRRHARRWTDLLTDPVHDPSLDPRCHRLRNGADLLNAVRSMHVVVLFATDGDKVCLVLRGSAALQPARRLWRSVSPGNGVKLAGQNKGASTAKDEGRDMFSPPACGSRFVVHTRIRYTARPPCVPPTVGRNPPAQSADYDQAGRRAGTQPSPCLLGLPGEPRILHFLGTHPSAIRLVQGRLAIAIFIFPRHPFRPVGTTPSSTTARSRFPQTPALPAHDFFSPRSESGRPPFVTAQEPPSNAIPTVGPGSSIVDHHPYPRPAVASVDRKHKPPRLDDTILKALVSTPRASKLGGGVRPIHLVDPFPPLDTSPPTRHSPT
ncbi:hypothetical protein EDB80DRAFT_806518 [Ilyonectria destructans]|nr:hypothetical protein EDB80DRAFT_806518 [Ilyonectria destructans]